MATDINLNSVELCGDTTSVTIEMNSNKNSIDEWVSKLFEVTKSIDNKVTHQVSNNKLVLQFSTSEYAKHTKTILDKYLTHSSARLDTRRLP
jgi:hypothetical protein